MTSDKFPVSAIGARPTDWHRIGLAARGIAVDALNRERAATAEKRAHEMLAVRHIRGEWFAVDRDAAISAVHAAVAALPPEESPAE